MRKKYDYHFIISNLCLSVAFDKYAKKHQNISFNRQARGFLMKSKIDYKKPWFEVENCIEYNDYLQRVVHAKWIND